MVLTPKLIAPTSQALFIENNYHLNEGSCYLTPLKGLYTMFICLCKAITDSQIKQAVDNGTITLTTVRKQAIKFAVNHCVKYQ